PSGVGRPEPGGPPVRQRLVIVAPTSVRFDSRTHRIASTVAARGHEVLVLGRAEPGLPLDEAHPSGYRIRRVEVAAVDGLPLPGALRRALAARWLDRPEPRVAPEPRAAPDPDRHGSLDPRPAVRDRGAERGPRVLRGPARVARIALTVRSQLRAARAVDPGADLYHGMAYMGIPVALGLARRSGAPVVYDARDIYIDAANLARLPGPARAVVGALERRWARRASRVVTVNNGYARVMADRWGVPMPAVVMNCPDPRPRMAERPRHFHATLGLAPTTPIVLYHGGFSPDRGIEELIEALALLPGIHLVLMGYGVLEAQLRARAAEGDGRLHVLPAVAPEVLLDWVASADVVAIPIQPTTLNHRLTTPNKLFEALAAGVPIVASDLPGMAPIVRETGAGVVCDPTRPAAIAAAIRGILELPEVERRAMGERGLRAAAEHYNWAAQVAVLLAEYGRLTGRPW
ncbi:MAG TPA: glycosyltransferase family 4 protein, partial [Candidatus Binatia bacterium]|nr:glycosyltransferase family 4 protein [Candidatus Binatia bacterium]